MNENNIPAVFADIFSAFGMMPEKKEETKNENEI